MTYDIESLLLDIKEVMADNLNTRILAINSEKDDDLTLDQIPVDAYFMQSMDGPQVNFDPYIFFGVESIEGSNDDISYGRTAEIVTVAVAIIVADEGTDTNMTRRLFRYQRALKETFEKNFNSISEGMKIAIQSEVPIDLSLMNNNFHHKAIGVTLKVAMG